MSKGCFSFHWVFSVLFSRDTPTEDTAGTDVRQKESQIDWKAEAFIITQKKTLSS